MNDYTLNFPAPSGWGTIIATISDSSGGALKSLKWANITALGGITKEYVDSKDHGRFIQTAWTDDSGNSELYNPTEGGSISDGPGSLLSSSKLISAFYDSVTNSLNTRTQLAFWRDVDNLRVAPFILDKSITLGWHGVWNVLRIHETLTLPKNVSFPLSQWEKLTAYLPSEFSVFETFNKTTGVTSTLTDGPGEQSFPVIMSTPDAQWALAMYAPDGNPGGGYGRWRYSDCVKMNAVSRVNNPVAGAVLTADTFITISSKSGALQSMQNLVVT